MRNIVRAHSETSEQLASSLSGEDAVVAKQMQPRRGLRAKVSFAVSRATAGGCLLLLLAVLFAPIYQYFLEPLPRMSVDAMNLPNPQPPVFNKAQFLDGSFQRYFDDWFRTRHGFYGYLVRFSNELTYRVFNQISLNYGSTVLVGKDKQLFQPMYLPSFNRSQIPPESELLKRAQELQRVQFLLKKRGIASTFVISTNLLEFYPELVPAAFTDPTREQRKSSYEKLVALLEEYGVDFVDGHQLLKEQQKNYDFRFFQSTASHWNQIAWCLVSQALANRLSELLAKPLTEVVCEPIEMSHRALGRDHDLLDVTNLYFIKDTYRPAPYLKPIEKQLDPNRYKPKTLFVGTSFSMTLTEEFLAQGVTDYVVLFFYYKKFRPGNGGLFPIDHANIDWENSVLNYDAIVIEANIGGLESAGFKFPGHLLSYLEQYPDGPPQ